MSTSSKGIKSKFKKCCFIGQAASGKTYWSKKFSELTGVGYFGLDDQIEKYLDSSISLIFEQKGEGFFRRHEQLLLQSAQKREALVLDPGAGVVEIPNNRKMIEEGCLVIYLFCPLQTLQNRLRDEHERQKRPLLHTRTNINIERIFKKRARLYAQMADLTLHAEYIGQLLPLMAKWWKKINS